MTCPRVGIIGARRARQGLGPYVARYLVDAGAAVPCFLATSAATRDEARAQLTAHAYITPQGYVDLGAMLETERLDALAILSPHSTHAAYLDAALEAGLPVLCEKPLVWGCDDLAGEAHRIVDSFADRRLGLWENCQWPYTLDAFDRLHPAVRKNVPERFEMRMSPTTSGPQIVADSLPHPLSLLQALAPAEDARIEDAVFAREGGDAAAVVLRFTYRAGAHRIASEVRLTPSPKQPRLTAYALDGCWARRLIRMDDYALFFSDGLRIVDVEDPLKRLVRAFVRALAEGADADREPRARRIRQRMGMLDCLLTALQERTR